MCGIVGYSGARRAQTVLFNSLAKLEYRGYDSCGIALLNERLEVFKDAVRVAELTKRAPVSDSCAGIGHTRWATHGAPSKINAHPHTDCKGRIALVHNGVISNYQKLRKQLTLEGHEFASDTDTEVICHLVENSYTNNLEEAVRSALKELEGSYAIIVIAEGESDLVFARNGSPLIIGLGDRENFLASDVPAILDYTSRVIYLEDGDMGSLSAGRVNISHMGEPVKRLEEKISWTPNQAQKAGYEHYMLKEIHEQPKIFRDTLSEYLSGIEIPLDLEQIDRANRRILFLASGSSYHAALIGKYICERLIDIPVTVEMASEFNYYYKLPYIPVTIGITQSGETADTLKALRRSKEAESKIIAITNVVGSTASKVADFTLYTRAGPEISVCATKTFMAQLVAIYWLAISYSNLDLDQKKNLIMDFKRLPDKLNQVLMLKDIISGRAGKLAGAEHVFYIGRGINYPVAMEGALKLKEVSYIHSEAYAAGEIKHGPFALLNSDTPVVAIVAGDRSHDAMLTSIKEIRARGAPIFAIVEEDDDSITDLADFLIPVPSVNEVFSPFINTMVVQLIGYFAANARNCPIDFPRNLAKSVTVE